MRRAAAGSVLAGLAVIAGCAATVPGTPTDAPASAVAPAGTVDEVAGCVRAALPTAKVDAGGEPPPRATGQIFVDIPRPDLASGMNRLGISRFGDADAARGFVASAGSFFTANGGLAEAVGPWVLAVPLPGDDAAVAAARRCVSGS